MLMSLHPKWSVLVVLVPLFALEIPLHSPPAVARSSSLAGPSAMAAASATGRAHGLGARPSFTDGRPAHLLRVGLSSPTAALAPSTMDLTPYDPPVGDQGSVNSCVSWATGYYLRGWLANRYQTPV